MKNFRQKIVFFSAALCASQSFAKSDENLTVNGKLWAQYSLDLTKDAEHNTGFDIYRAYLQAKYQFDPQWSTVVLIDHERNKIGSTGTPATWVYLRNAYVQAADLWAEKSNFRFGLQPTLYISTVDAALKTRWLGKSLADESGLLKSQEGAVAATGELGTMIRYGLMGHNGTEGLDRAGNSDNALGATALLSLSPFKGSEGILSGFAITVANTVLGASAPSQSSNVFSAALQLESDIVDTAVEFVHSKAKNSADIQACGATANVKISDSASIFGRYFTGNDTFKSFYKSKALATVGPTYSFIKDKVSTALLYERKEKASGTASQMVYWDWAANF